MLRAPKSGGRHLGLEIYCAFPRNLKRNIEQNTEMQSGDKLSSSESLLCEACMQIACQVLVISRKVSAAKCAGSCPLGLLSRCLWWMLPP